MEVDQNSVYNYYPVGQTVYIDLKGLSLSMYGDELQLGHPRRVSLPYTVGKSFRHT